MTYVWQYIVYLYILVHIYLPSRLHETQMKKEKDLMRLTSPHRSSKGSSTFPDDQADSLQSNMETVKSKVKIQKVKSEI